VRPRHRRKDIINMDLKELAVKIWTGIGWIRMRSRGREFLDQLSDCQLLKNNFSVKLLM
jgi:hypothetical protein